MSDSSRDGELQRTARKSGEELCESAAGQGASSPEVAASVVLYHRDGVRLVPLVEGRPVVIGRSAEADVCLRDDSISRRHARLELSEGQVWVEDLGSTNGTRIDGAPVGRGRVEPGVALGLGAVTGSIHLAPPMTSGQVDRCRHDRFQQDLEEEAARALALGRTLALVMVSVASLDRSPVGRWFGELRQQLEPFERIGMYSAETIELLLPEAGEERVRALLGALDAGTDRPLVAMGILPAHAGSAGELMEVTRAALHRGDADGPIRLARPTAARRDEDRDRGRIVVARSRAMAAVLGTAKRLAGSAIPVLLLGDTGTGKEVVARAIHDGGPRRRGPLICVNCGGLAASLVESTLFGHERGAFTGASQQTKGVFESADGGTVLLDEVGELTPTAQSALLRVLETKRFCRVGGSREIEVDVRVIAATHRDLGAMCVAGEFREDLYYRLNAISLAIPPLRDRPEDIEPLVEHFVRQAGQANGRTIRRMLPEAMELLRRYRWPGNVRELRNAIERAVVIAVDDVITPDDLPERVRVEAEEAAAEERPRDRARESIQTMPPGGMAVLKERLQRIQADMILEALRRTGWDRRQAAVDLGLPLRTLAHKMKVLGIKRGGYGREG